MSVLLASRPRRKGISLTALIDVVFILLMFFMLTSSFTRFRAVDLIAPAQTRTEKAEAPQVLILDAKGALQMPNGGFSLADYRDLQTLHLDALEVERPVVVVPEADVSVQTIVAVLEQLKSIDLKVSLGPARQ